jgi:hypothetical protein
VVDDLTAENLAEMPKPALRWKKDEDESIKMTYGLLMDLQRLLPNPAAALESVMIDPYTQDYIVRRVMTPSSATISKVSDLRLAEDIDLDPEQIESLLDWVVQHILHFFAKRAVNLTATGKQFQTALPSLFTTGLPASPLTTQSAGPSESPKTTSEPSTGD